MKKIITGIIISLLISSPIFGQNNAEKAKKILDNVSEQTKNYSTIQVNFIFSQQTKDAESEANRTQGTLLLKGNKYKLTLLGNTIYNDGANVWTHMLEENEVIIAKVNKDDENNFNPAKMLTIYETGFKYKFIQERFEANRAIYIIDLYPKKIEESEYSRIRLFIDKDKSQLWKIEYFAKDENVYTITINTFVTDKSLANSTFVFDTEAHPDAMIIDER